MTPIASTRPPALAIVCQAPRTQRLRRKLEKQAAHLSKLRGSLEDQRRKQLWDIAKAIDEIAKVELGSLERGLDLSTLRSSAAQSTMDEADTDEFEVRFEEA